MGKKISLTAKNPFGRDVELLSWKTWLGLGAFTVMLVGVGVMYKFASSKVTGVTNAALTAFKDVMGVAT